MKKLFILAAVCCLACLGVSCQKDTDTGVDTDVNEKPADNSDIPNPVAGTTWEWSEDPITWTFTFGEDEVTFDYRAEFSPNDISTDQFKAPYSYTEDTVTFEIKVWSGIVWKYVGTIDGDKMNLVDAGTEKVNVVLTKK